MAQVETVVIKITGDSKDIDKTINQLEKLGEVDKKNAQTFKKTSESNQKNIKKTEGSLKGLEKTVLSLGGALLGAFAIKAVIGSAITILKDFEKELSTLQSITGSTAEQMEFFSKAAREIGRATKTSATEVVKAFTLIGSAQPELLKNQDALASVTEQALILAKAAGIDTVAAAEALTGAMNQFGASAEDAAKFTDIFATSQQKGSSFINATAEALKNTGAAANAAGISFETTNAAIQALAKGSLLGSEAGTALRGVLIKLSSQSDDKINPSMVGLGKTIDELAKRNLTLADATKLVGQEGATGLLTLIKQKDTFNELDGALNEVGNAMEQMLINTDNLDGSLDELDNAYEEFVLALGRSTGILKTVTDSLTDFLNVTTDIVDSDIDLIGQLLLLTDQFLGQGVVARQVTEALAEQSKETEELAMMGGELIKTEEELIEIEIARVKTIGDLKKELQELRKAQDGLIPGSQTLLENQRRIAEIQRILKGEVDKSVGAFDMLRKQVSDLNKELLNQSVTGNINKETVKALKTALDKLAEAEVNLKIAVTDTLEPIKAQRLELLKISEIDFIPFDQEAEDLEDLIELTEKRIAVIRNVAEAEQAAFRILENINNKKLILIDNEQIAEEIKLKAKFERGILTEEMLAAGQLKIQEESDKERAEILTKQAKNDKAAAIIQATINTAIAVSRALITSPAFAILIGILGATEVATIAAQPIPTFHEGKKAELKEGEMFAKILKSETVIPPKESKRHKQLLDSVIDGNLSEYVFKHYQLPLLKEQSRETNIFNDRNITSKQKKTNQLLTENNTLLRNLKPNNNRRSYGWR